MHIIIIYIFLASAWSHRDSILGNDRIIVCFIDYKSFCISLWFIAFKILSPFLSFSCREGSVTLSCEVSHAKGKVVWRRNAVEIKPSKRFQIDEEGVRRTLTITGIRAEDEGEYLCESRDDKSSITITPKGMSLEMKADSVEGSVASLISHYNTAKLSLFVCLCCSLC